MNPDDLFVDDKPLTIAVIREELEWYLSLEKTLKARLIATPFIPAQTAIKAMLEIVAKEKMACEIAILEIERHHEQPAIGH